MKSIRIRVSLITAVACLLISHAASGEVDLTRPASKRFADTDKGQDPSFRRHVVPLMSKVGCSGRACHGSFQGRGGFRLSLFGYDFKKDFEALTGGEKPRIDRKDSDESLILLKPTLQVKHGGKQVITEFKWRYNVIRKWIANGAKMDVEETGTFDRLEIHPKEIIFNNPDQKIQIRVMAHWADGTVENVTDLARFRTNDESVAQITKEGVVINKGVGDTHIVAFYDNGVTPIPVMRPVSERVGSKYPDVAVRTKLDGHVMQKLRKVGIVPSDVCNDSEFLRRVSLDLTGTLPSPQDVKAFLADKSPDKRSNKIDQLLKSPGYAAWWTTKMCDWTGNNERNLTSKYFKKEQAVQWYDWIYKRVSDNEPYDKIVEGIVLAKGRSSPDQTYISYAKEMSSYYRQKNPVDFTERPNMPHYWMRRNMRKPEERALSFSYAFLGVRLQCAQCHKHPFDQWTQQDFQQFQAFFTPIYYGTPPDGRDQYKQMQQDIAKAVGYSKDIKDAKEAQKRKKQMRNEEKRRVLAGEPVPWVDLFVREPKKLSASQLARLKKQKKNISYGRVITPKLLGGDEIVDGYQDPRQPLMDWLRDNNPYFASSFVNRVWANYFGRGIVHPADDMNLANPPSNKALLNYLAVGFTESGYDMKWLHRTILNSDTYQRSWKTNTTNELDDRNFSRMVLRRLPAEVTVDAIHAATVSDPAAWAKDIASRGIGPATGSYKAKSGNGYAMGIFGKPVRMTTCDCERSDDPTLLQTIFMRNDRELYLMIDRKGGWIDTLRRAEGKTAPSKNAAAWARLEQTIKKRNMTKKQADALRKKHAARLGKPQKKNKKQQDVKPLDQDQLIEQVFLRTVSRLPGKSEISESRQLVQQAESVSEGIRELLWTMLNTKEFVVNH